MPVQKSRDLVLYIGDGASPESFAPLGLARLVGLSLFNPVADATTLGADGVQELKAGAGAQEMRITSSGFFRDQVAEEQVRAAAFGGAARNYRIVFPNGDTYTAAFVVREYRRGGTAEGLEEFSVTLQRTGLGAFVSA
jgi:predicted secreted protein